MTYFPAGRNSPDLVNIVDRYDDFPFYWFLMSILCYFSFCSIKGEFKKGKNKPQIKPLTFNNIKEFNDFKKAEKALGSKPFIWAIFTCVMAYPVWYLFGYVFNFIIGGCETCQIDKDWSYLILLYLIFVAPVISFKVSLKTMSSRLIKDGIITASSFNHMRSGRKTASRFNGSSQGTYGADSGGDCGGGE
jgi:hypothetical protein